MISDEIMKYLDDKEKLVVDFIVRLNGQALQKDIVGYGELTRPTVSRIIDKL